MSFILWEGEREMNTAHSSEVALHVLGTQWPIFTQAPSLVFHSKLTVVSTIRLAILQPQNNRLKDEKPTPWPAEQKDGKQKHPKDAKVHNGNVGDGKKTGTASL